MPDLLVEIGTEELPARRVTGAAEALRDSLAARLAAAGLLPPPPEGKGWPMLGTPRRLAAFLPGVRERQEDREERVWGPPVAAAFDREGRPTKAGEGFARSVGREPADLGRGEKIPGKPPYLCADRRVEGRTAAAVIAEILPEVVAGLPFRRSMRWPQSDLPFARPIRSLLVLLGREVVPCTLAGVEAGRATAGHSFLAPEPRELAAADLDAYRDALREARVLVDIGERGRAIADQVRRLRQELAGGEPASPWVEGDEDLLPEVVGLVEWPSALVGSFEERYLRLPGSVLTTAMAHHLRFFAVLGPDGAVRNRFLSVTDREAVSAEGIRAGNERVLRARLFDAAFFHGQDRRRRLEEFRPALAGVDFHRGLGTLLDKSERVRRVAAALAERVGLPAEARAHADRAAFLLKCDLLTELVKEFPELQGAIGGHYAREDGEPEAVALALRGQYFPRGGWDPVLDDDVAAVVSLAEKADSLVAYFSIGEEPTGSADPYGLRRHALGLLRILAAKPWALSVEDALAPAREAGRLPAEAAPRLHAFVWGRAEQEARARGFTDFIEVLGPATDRPYREYGRRLEALRDLSRGPRWRDLVALVERSANMGTPAAGAAPAPEAAEAMAPEVRDLREALEAATRDAGRKGEPAAFAAAYLERLHGPVERLFEVVLVDDPERPGQTAHLKGLLHEVFALFRARLGDLRKLGAGAKPPRA